MSVRIINADCRDALRSMPDASVHCCVTSPPYFGLRDYGMADQIGLEQTPDAFVAKLVAVFREVRRVLRDDGTLWLNLGDSYANDGKWGGSSGGKHVSALHGATSIGRGKVTTGLKPKDLIGIPWRVAFALQQPFYAGIVSNEMDRVWLAAMLDAEGCITASEYETGDRTKSNIYISITNASVPVIEKCGRVFPQAKENVYQKGGIVNRTVFRWDVERMEQKSLFLREIYPYLVAKRKQAILGYTFIEMQRGLPSKKKGYLPEQQEKRSWLVSALSTLNKGGDVDLPEWVAEPPSLFEPGYYLRQDIIWHKPNPMPESVTDRCTKAHEYVFLLSKSARYHFDAEAIAEAQVSDHTAGNHSHKSATAYNEGASEHRTKAGLVAFAQRSRVQSKRAAKIAQEAGLTDAHIAAIRAVGITDAGKAQTTQSGFGKNDATVQALADEAKAALGGYYREFLIPDKRNKRSVWTIATQPFSEAHFATMAPDLAETCIKAGCPKDGTVLDPFGGAGTTGLVADRLQRNAILIELNPEYAAMASKRLAGDAPLFAEVA